jgi:uncharacterized protein YegP (UPF0339 family)
MWTFSFYQDNAGEYRWRLKGANGEIIAQGEGHTRLSDAVRSAASFRANVAQARIVRPKIARPRRNIAQPPQRIPLLDGLVAQSQRHYGSRPN